MLRSSTSFLPILFLLATLSTSSAQLLFQNSPAKLSALDHLIETSYALNDLMRFGNNDAHLYWIDFKEDCSPVNSLHEFIEQDHNQTTLYLSVTQPCVEENIPLTDFQVSVDAARRLSVSAKVSAGENASLSKQYQLPSLAASGLVSAAYTPDRVLRVTIPHLSPDDLNPTDIPITIEPAPEPEHPTAAEQPTPEHTPATVGNKVEPLPEQDIEGGGFMVDVEPVCVKVTSPEMPSVESDSSIESDIPRKFQVREEDGKRKREERLRSYLLEYEEKLAAYSHEINKLASIRDINNRNSLSHDSSEQHAATGKSKHVNDDQPQTVDTTTQHQSKPQSEAARSYYMQGVEAQTVAQIKGSEAPTTVHPSSASPPKTHIAEDSYIAGAKARAAEGKKHTTAPTSGAPSVKEQNFKMKKPSPVDTKQASGDKKQALPEPKKKSRGSQTIPVEHSVNKEKKEQHKPPQPPTSSHHRTEKGGNQPDHLHQSHKQARKHQPERVGARDTLKAQDDPYRPMPTKRAVREAEKEASRKGNHSDDEKENVERLEGELARLRGLLAA